MRLSRPAFYSALGSCLIHGLSLSFAATLIVSGFPPPPLSIKVSLVERAVPLPMGKRTAVKEPERKPVEKPVLFPPKPRPVTKARRLSSPPKTVTPRPAAPLPPVEPQKMPTPVSPINAKDANDAADQSAPALSTDAVPEGEGGPTLMGKTSDTTKIGGSGGEARCAAQPDYGVNPKPPYPMLARRLGAQGVVLLRVHVRKDGTVADVELARSSGFSMLDDAATRTVRERWRFVPARVDGAPVASWVEVPIRFVLEDS